MLSKPLKVAGWALAAALAATPALAQVSGVPAVAPVKKGSKASGEEIAIGVLAAAAVVGGIIVATDGGNDTPVVPPPPPPPPVSP